MRPTIEPAMGNKSMQPATSGTDTTNIFTIELHLEEAQAMALAQFVKRVGWTELRANAVNDAEAYDIRTTVDALQLALAEAGFAPS